MKILGKSGDTRYPTFIVSLNHQEFSAMTGIRADNAYRNEYDICEQYEKALEVLRAVGDAMKLPNALRSVADCLDMAMPAAKAIADGKKLPEDPPEVEEKV